MDEINPWPGINPNAAIPTAQGDIRPSSWMWTSAVGQYPMPGTRPAKKCLVAFDGDTVTITTENGMGDSYELCLEPGVWLALREFVARFRCTDCDEENNDDAD